MNIRNNINVNGASIYDIEFALKIHCKRRARHLCKLYAEEHGSTPEEVSSIYEELKSRYNLFFD